MHLAEALFAVYEEALGQMREDREEDAILEPVAQALGVFTAAVRMSSSQHPLALGLWLEGDRAQKNNHQ